MKQPRNNKLQIVRIAAPMIEEQEESLKTLKDLLEQEETVSSLSFNKITKNSFILLTGLLKSAHSVVSLSEIVN